MSEMSDREIADLIEGAEVDYQTTPATEQSTVTARMLASGKVVWAVKVVVGTTDDELNTAVDQAKAALVRGRS